MRATCVPSPQRGARPFLLPVRRCEGSKTACDVTGCLTPAPSIDMGSVRWMGAGTRHADDRSRMLHHGTGRHGPCSSTISQSGASPALARRGTGGLSPFAFPAISGRPLMRLGGSAVTTASPTTSRRSWLNTTACRCRATQQWGTTIIRSHFCEPVDPRKKDHHPTCLAAAKGGDRYEKENSCHARRSVDYPTSSRLSLPTRLGVSSSALGGETRD